MGKITSLKSFVIHFVFKDSSEIKLISVEEEISKESKYSEKKDSLLTISFAIYVLRNF